MASALRVSSALVALMLIVLCAGLFTQWQHSRSLLGLYQTSRGSLLVEVSLAEDGYGTLSWGEVRPSPEISSSSGEEGTWKEAKGIVSLRLPSGSVEFAVIRGEHGPALRPTGSHPIVGTKDLVRILRWP